MAGSRVSVSTRPSRARRRDAALAEFNESMGDAGTRRERLLAREREDRRTMRGCSSVDRESMGLALTTAHKAFPSKDVATPSSTAGAAPQEGPNCASRAPPQSFCSGALRHCARSTDRHDGPQLVVWCWRSITSRGQSTVLGRRRAHALNLQHPRNGSDAYGPRSAWCAARPGAPVPSVRAANLPTRSAEQHSARTSAPATKASGAWLTNFDGKQRGSNTREQGERSCDARRARRSSARRSRAGARARKGIARMTMSAPAAAKARSNSEESPGPRSVVPS